MIRHPMPYGDLDEQVAQRFETLRGPRSTHDCTIEEREEYEPHLEQGSIVYAGVDYEEILEQAQQGSRRHPVGRRQQRPSVLQARTFTSRSPTRSASVTRRLVSPGRGEPTDGRRRRHQQDRLRQARGRRDAEGHDRSGEPRREIVEAQLSGHHSTRTSILEGKKVLVVEDGPDAHARRDELRSRRGRGPRAGAAALVDPRPWASRLDQGRLRQVPAHRASCCRRWATRSSSARTWPTRSTRRMPTSCSSLRRSTFARSSTSRSRPCERPTGSMRSRAPSLTDILAERLLGL